MDPALVRALAADHETWPTDDPRLLAIRERAGARRRAVLVVDAALEVWWAERRAADPERAGAALAAHVSRAVAEARPGERYLVLDGGRLTPSTRTTPPAVRETAPTTGGRWVAYVPIEGDGSADPG
ncbi:hypothetical protein DOU15_02180 [Clavibacter michiganensis subsp. michiganensis]|uniref:hypothetical protein n=1 Tax=Clavibacter michiganensis TaxID=28447 RepID=UPI000A37FD72|nr:hypothetical protein [Clavibacter michiganensis]MWJ14703.1 hypothetical protein [Clavibacter michiganensis subsp. michiganensis]OUD90650.1 hypothetical protein CMMCAS05_11170 [Clavibacter michiganensis subsp. michiganensis]OUE14309.1 hypothetical protein CMMCAY01_15020 [Clavibacter michiganensis subsp. michiganensis]UOW03533.1 hypothetical protein MU580_14940 [Clavibacter michiganensis subsp. michiganensis]